MFWIHLINLRYTTPAKKKNRRKHNESSYVTLSHKYRRPQNLATEY